MATGRLGEVAEAAALAPGLGHALDAHRVTQVKKNGVDLGLAPVSWAGLRSLNVYITEWLSGILGQSWVIPYYPIFIIPGSWVNPVTWAICFLRVPRVPSKGNPR